MPTQLVLIVATVAGLLTGGLYLSVMGGPAFILLQYMTQLPLFLVGFSLGFVPALMSSGVALVSRWSQMQLSDWCFLLVISAPHC